MMAKKNQDVGEKIGSALQTAKDGVISFGASVTSKSKDLMDIAGLKNERAKFERDKARDLVELGHLAYDADAYTPAMKKLKKQIAATDKSMEKIDTQIAKIKAEADAKAAAAKTAAKAKPAAKPKAKK